MMTRDRTRGYRIGVIAREDEVNASIGEAKTAGKIRNPPDLFLLRADAYPWHRCPTRPHRRE